MNVDNAERTLKAVQSALDRAIELNQPWEVIAPLHDAMTAAMNHARECRRYNRQYDPRTLPRS